MNEPTDSRRESPAIPEVDADIEREIAEALGDGNVEQLMQQADAIPAAPDSDAPGDDTDPTADAAPNADTDHPSPHPDEVGFTLKRGRIAAVQGDDVFVNLVGVDSKLQGIVPLKQFDRPPRPGAIMDFVVDRVEESEGLIHLSREGAVTATAWDQMTRGMTVEGRVVATNKGGLELEMAGGIRAFMPISQIDLHHVDEVETFVGQKLAAAVVEVNLRKKRVILSRRRHLEKQREIAREKLLKELEVDQTREGSVTSIVPYGAFIDLGGLDGLIHISDLSYGRVNKVEEVLKVGQNVTVKVLKIEEEGQRIRLGLKQSEPDPWQAAEGKYLVGSQVAGRIVRLASFGGFVELEPGIEGLLPISEMSWKRINSPQEIVREGDVLKLAILKLDVEKRRLTLSLKQAQGDPWKDVQTKVPKHQLIEGVVVRITDFGAFVEIETGLEGLVHISELADRRVGQVDEVLKVGDTRTFRVLDVDGENRKIGLSLKAVDHPPPASAPPPEPPTPEQLKKQQKAQAAAKLRKEQLKGGMGQGGGMGMGLGNLKL